MRIAVEIVDSRLPRGLGALAELSDGFNNGAFVAGPRIHAWHGLDFAALAIVLTRTDAGASTGDRARQRAPRSSTAIRSAPSCSSPTRRQARARPHRAATSSPPARAPARRDCRERARIAPTSAILGRVAFRFLA